MTVIRAYRKLIHPSWLSSRDFFLGGKISCYTSFFCYANFSVVFGPSFGRGEETASGVPPAPHPRGRKPTSANKLKTNYYTLIEIRKKILRSNWLRDSPYIGAQTGIWTVQYSYTVKFHLILFYLERCTIKHLLIEISVHNGIFVLTFKMHGSHCVQSILLECQNKYFVVYTSCSVRTW